MVLVTTLNKSTNARIIGRDIDKEKKKNFGAKQTTNNRKQILKRELGHERVFNGKSGAKNIQLVYHGTRKKNKIVTNANTRCTDTLRKDQISDRERRKGRRKTCNKRKKERK